MVASRIVFFCFYYILCFVCGSQPKCSRANAEQSLRTEGKNAAKFGSAFERLFILLYEQQTKNTPQNIPLL